MLLAVFALPTVLTSTWRPAVERVARRSAAPSPPASAAICSRRRRRRRRAKKCGCSASASAWSSCGGEAWEQWHGPVAAARWGSAAWHTLAWAVFGGAYVGAVVFVATRAGLDARRRAARARGRLAPVGLHRRDGRRDRVPPRHLDGRLTPSGLARGLRGVVRRGGAIGRCPARCTRASASITCRSPIRARRASCSTTSRCALPAGAVVAIVGENGAGKTTLVKLLAKMYEPTSGAIHVDGTPLARVPRRRLARAPGGRLPGLLPVRVQRPPHRRPRRRAAHGRRRGGACRAVERAGADDVIARLPAGLDTQLGPTWPGGVELSFGQWQKPGAGARLHARRIRCCWCSTSRRRRWTPRPSMRSSSATPPRRATAARDGRITILVSHRFSTVRMAEL